MGFPQSHPHSGNGDKMSERNFFAELKRRNVYKVAVAYAVVAWLLIQAASILFPTFEAPVWAMKVFVVAVVLGFPAALILSWAFEITSKGIKRAEDVLPTESITPHTGRKIVAVTAALGVLAASLLAFELLRSKSTISADVSPGDSRNAAAEISDKSIAVLPFENLSSDKENAYFAEGIQDEVLTRLAKIAALKVISRTSTQKYRSAPDNLREVRKQLGVANLLEGSVQKIANTVHVNVQLIRVATDEHLWAESYDRKLDNVFGVEGEVAMAVAEALKAKLTGAEQHTVGQRSTNNPQAYDAYLRGLAYSLRPGYSPVDNLAAIKYFGAAVKLDPNFALAWAWLGRENALGYFNNLEKNLPSLRDAAQQAANKAVELQPELGEAYLGQGYWQYYCERNYVSAVALFEKSGKLLPNNSLAPHALALVCRRLGEWQRSLDYFRNAVQMDPRDTALLTDQAEILDMLRQYPAALKVYDQVLDILPDNSNARWQVRPPLIRRRATSWRPLHCFLLCILSRSRIHSACKLSSGPVSAATRRLSLHCRQQRRRHLIAPPRKTITSISKPIWRGCTNSPARLSLHRPRGDKLKVKRKATRAEQGMITLSWRSWPRQL